MNAVPVVAAGVAVAVAGVLSDPVVPWLAPTLVTLVLAWWPALFALAILAGVVLTLGPDPDDQDQETR